MVRGDHFLQLAGIAVFAHAGMPDQLAIPNGMQITGVVATLGGPEYSHRNVVSSASIAHRVKRLAQVAYKMNQVFERFAAGCEGLRWITQDTGKSVDLRHHAIVVGAVLGLVPTCV